VIFEERMTHLAKQPIPMVFSEENDPFPLKPAQTTSKVIEPASKNTKNLSSSARHSPKTIDNARASL